jgi:D-xylonolactonase
MKIELLAEGYVFLEAPRVDSRNYLYFTDVSLGGIFRRAPDGKVEHMLTDRKPIGGLALNADGRIVVSGPGGLILFDEKTGDRENLFDTLDGKPVSSINDIQPDGEGGVYAGLVEAGTAVALMRGDNSKMSEPQPLALLTSGRRAHNVAVGAVVTNGIGISPDRRTVYQAETFDGILAFDRASDGSLFNRRLAIRQPMSDGIAVDSEGYVWIAAVQESAVVRYAPDGKFDRRIELPVKEVASLIFGGEDCRDLYVVTGSDIRKSSFERTGRVYRIRSEVAGQPTPLTKF